VARETARHAVALLREEGLVVIVPRCGVFVTDREQRSAPPAVLTGRSRLDAGTPVTQDRDQQVVPAFAALPPRCA